MRVVDSSGYFWNNYLAQCPVWEKLQYYNFPSDSRQHVETEGAGHRRFRQLGWRVRMLCFPLHEGNSTDSTCSGLEADQKVLAVHGCYALTATTSLTAQNTLGVHDIHLVPASFVKKQLEACLDDVGADVVKMGETQFLCTFCASHSAPLTPHMGKGCLHRRTRSRSLQIC